MVVTGRNRRELRVLAMWALAFLWCHRPPETEAGRLGELELILDGAKTKKDATIKQLPFPCAFLHISSVG